MGDDADTAEDRDSDRRLNEVTGELRLVLPVASILFVFLITLPFTARFGSLSGVDRGAYLLSFLSSALAIVFLMGETAYHQLQGRPYDKGRLVGTASRQAIAGLVLMAVALSSVAFLVTDVLYQHPAAALITASLLAVILLTWFVLPLARRWAYTHGEPSMSKSVEGL
jgi:hypothetical protein